MRSVDSIFNHEPAWRLEFRDREGFLVETTLIDEMERRRVLAGDIAEIMKCAGSDVVSMDIVSLNENLDEET